MTSLSCLLCSTLPVALALPGAATIFLYRIDSRTTSVIGRDLREWQALQRHAAVHAELDCLSARDSVQQTRHSLAVPAHARIVAQEFEHLHQSAACRAVIVTTIFLHQVEQQLHGRLVVLVDYPAKRQ